MEKRIKTIAILTLLGAPPYILCFGWHICMAGHMKHAPYPWYHWVNDFLWIICFSAVLVFTLRLLAKRKKLFLLGSLGLILFRIPLGSAGGGYVIFELPLLMLMVFYAIKYLIRPEKYTDK